MATILLSSAGSAIGAQVGGPIGAYIGRTIGTAIGGTIDNMIFGPRKLPESTGPRLSELSVQSSAYGKALPVVFGNARLAGNVIWSRPIKETSVSKTVSGGGGKGGGGGGSKTSQKQTTYEYTISMAVAICEGEIDDVVRVWADAGIIDPTKGVYRIYKGSETQNPDPFIESFEGIGKTPAYRGIAYVMIEDFPLGNYGNRIPNFTFEVRRKVIMESERPTVEEKIKAVVMIPGSGEFAYDTEVQSKIGGEIIGTQFVQNDVQVIINQNNRSGKADALVSLDQLKSELPNVEWVSVVAGWFGDSLDAGECLVLPGVEYNSGGSTTPATWSVAGFSRSSAKLITQTEGSPVYGGTPNDAALVKYVNELRERGYKVMFYPFIFMDVEGKPWRGRITGEATEVSAFFTKTNGYNQFVTHYANLLNGKVDAFCIGSELIGLTSVNDGADNFPAVAQLVSLAASVKGIVGSGTKVLYAADWSEYHHTVGGWYNLDPLWASSNIDVIGIDAYFPLRDAPQAGYDKQEIIDGWDEGEGFDWYYSDEARTNKVNLTPQMAWKNIAWWWSNSHVNPDGSITAWVPESKKIWFTEYGFPSVDGCANQPNVFYDPGSSESAFPRFSRGRVDFRAQRTAIEGTLDKWAGSDMVEELFLWTWDARPYPFYPDLRSVWNDGNLWLYGHWVTGKLGLSSLSAIIAEICERVGLDVGQLNLTRVNDLVDGFVLNTVSPARAGLEQLQKGFFFDAVESEGRLKFIPRGDDVVLTLDYEKLIPSNGRENVSLLNVKRRQELELPQKVDINYIDRGKEYQTGDQHSQRMVTEAEGKEIQNLAVVFNEWQAKRIADISLYNAWYARNSYEFSLPVEYAALEPADVIKVTMPEGEHIIRITENMLGLNGELRCKGVADDPAIYDFYATPMNDGVEVQTIQKLSATRLEIMDLPAFPNDEANAANIRFAGIGFGGNWDGAIVYRSDDEGASFAQAGEIAEAATIGNALTVLPDVLPDLVDENSRLEVSLIAGELQTVSNLAMLNGANIAVVGEEIIQFRSAELIAENKYRLSGLLRGRLGTEHLMTGHVAGERFVRVEATVDKEKMPLQLVGLSRKYKPVSSGANLSSGSVVDFIFKGNSLKPLSPVHVKASRDISGNASFEWIRRTRIGGELRDNADVPLSEEFEKYEVDILNGANVVRTISSTTPSCSYSAALQVTDFGSAQSSISIKVYQVSSVIGRGVAAAVTV